MGGISILMILAMMGVVTLAIIVAITLFIAATIISIVFAAQRKQRREQGKKSRSTYRASHSALHSKHSFTNCLQRSNLYSFFAKAALPSPTKIAHKQLFRTTSNSQKIALMRPNYSCHPKGPLRIKASSTLHLSMKTRIAYVHCSKTPGQTISQST